MHLYFRNVNDSFNGIVKMFATGEKGDGNAWQQAGNPAPIVRRPSRNGSVMVIDEPVTVTYTHPRERVLFNAARDANPFFHLMESLWMLAGRNDVAPLAYYSKQMSRYSDDGKTLNGAYGYRWRRASTWGPTPDSSLSEGFNPTDQLNIIINHLKADPHSRRAVLQMWNVEDDLLKIGCKVCDGRAKMMFMRDPGPCPTCGSGYKKRPPAPKDVCCNLSVMFAVRIDPFSTVNGTVERDGHVLPAGSKHLDMTVTNRSNDMVWGMLGANYVHFSFLQEYVAARVGAEVGRYHHFSNNLHVYDEPGNDNVPPWKPDAWLADPFVDEYTQGEFRYRTVPLVRDPAVFDRELLQVVDACWGYPDRGYGELPMLEEPFLQDVAVPMFRAFANHKAGDHKRAMYCLESCKSDDWRVAAVSWLLRRKK